MIHKSGRSDPHIQQSLFLCSMFTFRSVLECTMPVREKKIHRLLYTRRLGLIEYYMCCLRWCVRREGGAVVCRRRVVMVVRRVVACGAGPMVL